MHEEPQKLGHNIKMIVNSGGNTLINQHSVGWGAKFGSDDFELKGHLLSMVA